MKKSDCPTNQILVFDATEGMALTRCYYFLLLSCCCWGLAAAVEHTMSGSTAVGGGHVAGAAFLMVGEILVPVQSSHLSSSRGGSFGLSWTERTLSFVSKRAAYQQTQACLAACKVSSSACNAQIFLWAAHDGSCFTKHRNRLFQGE